MSNVCRVMQRFAVSKPWGLEWRRSSGEVSVPLTDPVRDAQEQPSHLLTGDRLDSWKEIAARLKRDVSTVQRWERREGLPVHRHLHDKRGSVYAYTSELDTWWEGRRQRLEAQPAGLLASPEQSRPFQPPRTIWIPSLLVLGLTVTLAVYAGISGRPMTSRAGADLRSVAVLPFKPLVPAAQDEYLELGMADAVITSLSRLRQLVVRPPTAIVKYAGSGQDPIAAGRELRVDAVLDGSVQRLGDRIKVTVRLIRVRDGRPLWADEFEQRSADLFDVQSSIAERVAAALALTLSGEENARLNRRETTNSEAYQLYLQGRYFWNKRTEESLRKAVNLFQRATEKDPGYALAHVGLADAYIQLGIDDIGGLAPIEAFPKARQAAVKALTIEDTLAEAHAALGFVKLQYDWDWRGAESELEHAILLDAKYAPAHQWYGLYLSRVGRHQQAIQETIRAYDLDPVSPAISRAVGFRFYEARRYDEAIQQLRKTLELEPNYAQARYTLGLAYVQTGRFEDAIRELQEGIKLSGGSRTITGALGYAYARAGKTGDARRVLEELMAQPGGRYVSPYNVALIFTGFSDNDRAFEWLERAYQGRASRLGWLAVLPEFDSLRPDPRFSDLLRRIGLPVNH
jgi:TolB-like protein/TolA-binding protein